MVEAIRQGDIPGVQLRRRQLLPVADLEEAWGWLTEPRRLARWLADEAEVDSKPGGFLRLKGRGPDGETIVEHGKTVAIEPPTRWVLDFLQEGAGWDATTRLELEISAAQRGCELMVFQEGFQRLSLSTSLTVWEAYRERWTRALSVLAATL
jgi:uncharacterized protein YndB with AHSA1/START domain